MRLAPTLTAAGLALLCVACASRTEVPAITTATDVPTSESTAKPRPAVTAAQASLAAARKAEAQAFERWRNGTLSHREVVEAQVRTAEAALTLAQTQDADAKAVAKACDALEQRLAEAAQLARKIADAGLDDEYAALAAEARLAQFRANRWRIVPHPAADGCK